MRKIFLIQTQNMYAIKQRTRNHASRFIGDKEAHKAFKRLENRAKRELSDRKDKTISIVRKGRGKGYAAPGYFDTSMECEVHGNLTLKRPTSFPVPNNRGTQLMSCNGDPIHWIATGRGISMPRGEAELNWELIGYDLNLSSHEGKVLLEHCSQGWE